MIFLESEAETESETEKQGKKRNIKEARRQIVSESGLFFLKKRIIAGVITKKIKKYCTLEGRQAKAWKGSDEKKA